MKNIFFYRIIEKNGGKPPLTYHQFQAVVSSMGSPPVPESTVTSANVGSAYTPLSDDHDEKYGVPSLEELGKVIV
jgi:cryptochrome